MSNHLPTLWLCGSVFSIRLEVYVLEISRALTQMSPQHLGGVQPLTFSPSFFFVTFPDVLPKVFV